MARVLIRCIIHLKNPTFSHSSHPQFPFPSQQYSSLPSISHSNWISNFLNQCLNRSHLHQIHAQLLISGRLQNPFLASKLLNLASRFESLGYALWVFKGVKNPDIVCVNAVIKAYSSSSVAKEGVVFYYERVKSGVVPNSFTFPPLIGCCAKVGCGRNGEMCHGQVIKKGFNGVIEIENSLIHMYGCCGVIDSAVDVFWGMCDRDLVSWNSIVDGFVKVGDLGSAHKLFDELPERNVVSWNVMMTGYLNGKNPGCVLKLFRDMVRSGLLGNDTTVVNVLTACGRSARLKEGASVHGFLFRRLRRLNLIMNTALIDMYGKCQKVSFARRVFDDLQERNLACWNAMILGHCLHGDPLVGLNLFAEMLRNNNNNNNSQCGSRLCKRDPEVGSLISSTDNMLFPDEITYVGVLCACVRAGLLTEGKTHFHQMESLFKIRPNFGHYWCMANLLASNGLVQEALETIRKVNKSNLNDASSPYSSVWAGLLGSCRFQGDSSLAEKVARDLVELEPENSMCYALLLNVYAAAGRWEDAAAVKELMKQEFGGKMPGCSLLDLVEIVHNFRVSDRMQSATERMMMMNASTAESLGSSNGSL